jgi:hypothetical protein
MLVCSAFLNKLPEAFTQLTVGFHCVYVSHLFNIWEVCNKPGRMGNFTALTKFHAFKVQHNNQGNVAVWYKLWSRHRFWKPFQTTMGGDTVFEGGVPVTSKLGHHSFFHSGSAPDQDELPPLKGIKAKSYSSKELSSGIDVVLDKLHSLGDAGDSCSSCVLPLTT